MVNAATTPIIPNVIKTSAKVNAEIRLNSEFRGGGEPQCLIMFHFQPPFFIIMEGVRKLVKRSTTLHYPTIEVKIETIDFKINTKIWHITQPAESNASKIGI